MAGLIQAQLFQVLQTLPVASRVPPPRGAALRLAEEHNMLTRMKEWREERDADY